MNLFVRHTRTSLLAVVSMVLLALSQPLVVRAACEEYSCDAVRDDDDAYLDCVADKKSCLESKLSEVRSEKITLTNTINIINGQISIQELEIAKLTGEISILQSQISLLTERISGLALSLDQLSAVLVTRIREQYKQQRISPLSIIMSADTAKEAFSQYKYLSYASQQTADAMQRAELQRLDYDNQKQLKVEAQTILQTKQTALEVEQNKLAKQKTEQQYLLNETKNHESRYQAELATTLAEISAIQSIIAGRGSESKVGSVTEGETIASIISGASACSTGTHLHFEVTKSNINRDPASYLKSVSINWSNSPDGTFGFSGDWEWPVNDPARITQGYGMTYYARVRRAYGGAPHTGIDMVSKSGNLDVEAVQSGTLYRGSIPCGGGLLRYVRVKHDNSDYDTLYLHVNYI